MEFLKSLKEAMSNGISKDEFMVIWNLEMELKSSNSTALSDTEMELKSSNSTALTNTEMELKSSNSTALSDTEMELKSSNNTALSDTEMELQSSNSTALSDTEMELKSSNSTALSNTEMELKSSNSTALNNREMELKSSNNTALSNTSEDVTEADAERADCTEEEDSVMSLLLEIVKQQSESHQQQTRIEQRLKDLQSTHDKEQQKMQQQFENMQEIISGKVLALETGLANLQQSFAHNVRHYVHSESLDVQEKLLLMTDTIYNNIFKEMRNVLHGVAGDVRTTTFKADIIKKKQVKAECQLSEESAAEASTKDHPDNITDDCGDNKSVGKEKKPPSITEETADGFKKVSFIEISASFRNTLCSELSTFLVSIQKLLLRPLNSEDVSFYITDRMKELFQQERNNTADQLLNVQTAISGDIHARLYKIETCFKQELQRTRSCFEHDEKLKHEFSKILEEMCKLKSFISSELPMRMMSNGKLAPVSEMESPSGLGRKEVNQLGDNKVIRHDGPQERNEVSQLGKKMHGGGNYHPNGNDKDNINLCPTEVSNEQIQTIIFMLFMYMLTLLTYRDTLGRTNTSETAKKCARSELQSSSDTPCQLLESETSPEKPAKKRKFGSQKKEVPIQLTDAHLKLMLGNHKEAQYLCCLKNIKVSPKEECFYLNDIAPGYNLLLQTKITDENNNLNLHIMSVSGQQNNSLTWPAEFSITIKLMDKKPLACLQTDKWQSFTKTKTISRPNKSTGHSTPTPFCYFRENVINRVIDNDSLTFHISVQYIGDGKDK